MNFSLPLPSIRKWTGRSRASTAEHAPPCETDSLSFHVWMATVSLTIVAVYIAGSHWTNLHVVGMGEQATGILILAAMMMPLPAYWHSKQRFALRDATLTLPWAFLLSLLLPLPFLVAAHLQVPLQDAWFASIDSALGYHSAALVGWASHHWAGSLLSATYGLLQPFMLIAVLAPALAGKPQAKQYLLANIFALGIAGGLFAMLPAIGPWFPHHFPASLPQQACEAQLLGLRQPGAYLFSFQLQATGFVCFPSCHVIWAVLSAAALWGFRPLRIPVTILAAMIVFSTLTTGWHYLCDVLAGLALAAASLWLAKRLTSHPGKHPSRL